MDLAVTKIKEEPDDGQADFCWNQIKEEMPDWPIDLPLKIEIKAEWSDYDSSEDQIIGGNEEAKSPDALSHSRIEETDLSEEQEVKPPLAVFLLEHENEVDVEREALLLPSPSLVSRNDALVSRGVLEKGCETNNALEPLASKDCLSAPSVLSCSVCNRNFRKQYTLENHMKSHKQNRLYKCYFCNKWDLTKCSLIKHMQVHAQAKSHVCGVCARRFLKKGSLITHMHVHSKDKPHECVICNKVFLRKHNLITHMGTHQEAPVETTFQCSVCNKYFAKECTLTSHMKTHSYENLFQCPTCKMVLLSEQKFIHHVQNHPEERLYTCTVCKKPILSKDALILHMSEHTKQESHMCVICNKRFLRKTDLHIHLRMHSKGMYECTVCNMQFVRIRDLSTHWNSLCGKTVFKCSVCKRSCSKKNTLLKHVVENPYLCVECRNS